MDWQRYKALCDRPDVVSRWLLTETAALLPERLRPALAAAMAQAPLAKPPDHKGGAATDMFEVDSRVPVAEILVAVEQAAERGERASTGRGLGGFVSAWRELAHWRRDG